ncbi:gluconokinase [Pelobium manganitolerans]|uniref:gluconokinase n=1 Tax=Pelobium manganitolerans TaxID=1842495 RepID=UPI003FA3AE27
MDLTKDKPRTDCYFVIFGISGSGKTLIGQMLAQRLGIDFIEGDDYHPQANINKMKSGHALNDQDRAPWLKLLEQEIELRVKAKKPFVLSCSALRLVYRDALRKGGAIRFLFLDVAEDVVAERLKLRTGHFMPASLLHSQSLTLEKPTSKETDVVFINAAQKPGDVVAEIIRKTT